jgi:hypothetical protein
MGARHTTFGFIRAVLTATIGGKGVTYLQKDNKKISINEARRLITSLPPNERDAVRIPTNDRKVAQRPRDGADNGYYNLKEK